MRGQRLVLSILYLPLNSTIDSIAFLLKKQLNEVKGIKHIETLKLTFKKTTVDADQ